MQNEEMLKLNMIFFWEGGVIYLDGKEGVASQDLNAAMYYFILIDASHNNKKVLDFKVN
ncbi:hypothetical protein AGMMS49592_0060 [Endomicrobiia bacterium]|nr:hypothetical protein AGMMS49592_0060 [Endomicrobiia bacterium]